MKRVAPCICLFALTLWGQTAKRPSTVPSSGLITSRQDTLGKVIAGTAVETQRPAIPAAARTIPVLTCVYSDGAGGTQEAHYWVGAPPPWHSAIPAAHPLNKLVQAPLQTCPPSIAPAVAAARSAVPPATPLSQQPVEEEVVRPKVPLPSFELTAADFNTQGLEYEHIWKALYAGNFRAVPFERDSAELRIAMNSYIVTFSRGCRSSLRGEVLEITNWNRQAGMIVYVESDLLEARRQLEQIGAGLSLSDALSMLQDGGQSMLRLGRNAMALKTEVEDLISRNGCGSRALRRFRDNLRQFALDDKPLVLAGGAGTTPAPSKPAVQPAKNHDFTRLVDDLIGVSSRSWAINRYISGSASDARVVSRDAEGAPRRVEASYVFNGFSGRSRGSVMLEFTRGRPSCMYFFDMPTVCRPADRQIVAAYEEGRYATPK